jgi:hypothetical protein
MLTKQTETVSTTNKILARFKLIACCTPRDALLIVIPWLESYKQLLLPIEDESQQC